MNKEELFYSEMVRRTQEQYSSKQHFDTMATAVLGLGGVILSAMVITVSYWSSFSRFVAIAVIFFFSILALSTIWGLWSRSWKFKPKLDTLESWVELSGHEGSIIKLTADAMSDGIEINEQRLTEKAICLRISYIALAVETIVLGFLILSLTIHQ